MFKVFILLIIGNIFGNHIRIREIEKAFSYFFFFFLILHYIQRYRIIHYTSQEVGLRRKGERFDRPLGNFFSRPFPFMDVGHTVGDVPAVEGADENAGEDHHRVLTPEDIQSDKVFP